MNRHGLLILVSGLVSWSGCAMDSARRPVFESSINQAADRAQTHRARLVTLRQEPPIRSLETSVDKGFESQEFRAEEPVNLSGRSAVDGDVVRVVEEIAAGGGGTELSRTDVAPQRVTYSVPSAWARRLAQVSTVSTVVGTSIAEEAGREAAEGAVMNGAVVGGRAGLASPEPVIGAALTSRPGLQENNISGLGFGSPTANVFTPTFNPLSGPGGRCAELGRAGFFGANAGACEQHFRR